jgi:hypothetical protein
VAVTPVTFDVQATDPENDHLKYFWEFPDGSTSDQQSFSRLFQVGGVHNSRVTVSDGATSTNREFAFELKSVTGEWIESPGNRILSLVQNGSTLAGTMPYGGTTCSVMGSLRPSAPHMILDIPACGVPVVFNGQQIAFATYQWHMELAFDSVVEGLSGIENEHLTNEPIRGAIQHFDFTRSIQLKRR